MNHLDNPPGGARPEQMALLVHEAQIAQLENDIEELQRRMEVQRAVYQHPDTHEFNRIVATGRYQRFEQELVAKERQKTALHHELDALLQHIRQLQTPVAIAHQASSHLGPEASPGVLTSSFDQIITQNNLPPTSTVNEFQPYREPQTQRQRSTPCGPNAMPDEELLQILKTPCPEVFTADGRDGHYRGPAWMRGVPVRRISPGDPYWQRSWIDETAFLKKRDELKAKVEEREERIYGVMYKSFHFAGAELPVPRDLETFERERLEQLKQDLKSVKKNLRYCTAAEEAFKCLENVHPNQLVAKRYLPAEGILHPTNTLYQFALRLKDLAYLHEKGELSMKPFDFLRWRIGTVIERTGANYKTTISNIINEGDRRYDRVVRAVMQRVDDHQRALQPPPSNAAQ